MKKIKLRELSPLVISVFILSIFIIGLVSAAATTNNGSIGGLFFRYVGDNGYDYNLQQFTSSGYRLDGRNIHTDFGGKDLTTTGSINNVNTVNSNILHTNGLGNGQIWLDGSRMDANTTINIGAGLVGGQTVKSVNLGGNLTVKGGNIDMLKGATSKIHSLGTMSFDWTLGGTYDYSSFHGIESKNEAGTFSDSMRIISYGIIINTIDGNANSISKFIIQKESSGNGVDLLTVDEAGNTIIAGKVTSSATVSADGINTLTTKKYVDDEVTKLVISCPTGQVLQSVGKNSSTCITDATIADTDTWITTQTCPTGQALQSVGKNSSICVGLLSGPRGPRGWTGLTGASGTAGTQGPRGLTGAPGTAGTQGLRGSQGIQGPAGGAASLVKFLKVTGGGRSGVGYCSGVWGTAKCDYSYDADITCAIGTYRLSEGWSVASTQNYKYICVTVQ